MKSIVRFLGIEPLPWDAWWVVWFELWQTLCMLISMFLLGVFLGAVIELNFKLEYIQTFLQMLVLDFLWAVYIRSVAQHAAVKAGIIGSALFILGSLVTISYVHDAWNIVPAALGGFLGTYWSVKQKT